MFHAHDRDRTRPQHNDHYCQRGHYDGLDTYQKMTVILTTQIPIISTTNRIRLTNMTIMIIMIIVINMRMRMLLNAWPHIVFYKLSIRVVTAAGFACNAAHGDS